MTVPVSSRSPGPDRAVAAAAPVPTLDDRMQPAANQGADAPAWGDKGARSAGRCAACQSGNDLDRNFCGACGAALYESCSGCENRAGVWDDFCPQCGADLRTIRSQQIQQASEALAGALSLRKEYRYQDAIDRLQSVCGANHPVLAAYRAKAVDLLSTLREEAARGRETAQRALRRADELVLDFDFQSAAEILQTLPVALLDEQGRAMLADVSRKAAECRQLEVTIRTGLDDRCYLGLCDKIDRLLRLKPNHQAARQLREKIAPLEARARAEHVAQLTKTAKRRLAAHDYAGTLELLDERIDGAPDDAVQQLRDFAAECAWLEQRVKSATFLDEQLPRFARRLAKLQPADPSAVQTADRLEQLIKQPGAIGRRLRSNGSSGDGAGQSVQLLRRFQRIDVSALQSAGPSFDHAGRYFVAAGLALQGLGRATIDVNLAPPQRRGVAGRLSKWVGRRSFDSAWGVDVGQTALKAILLTANEDAEIVTAAAAYRREYPEAVGQGDEEIRRHQRAAVADFVATHRLGRAAVCASFPASILLARFIKTPPIDLKKIPELLKYETRQQIPFPLEQVTHAHTLFQAPNERRFAERRAGIFAVKNRLLLEALAPLQENGVTPHVVQSDAVALYNALAFDRRWECDASGTEEETAGRGGLELALDVGAHASNLLFVGDGVFWLRSVPLGGSHFTAALVKHRTLTWKRAEHFKRHPTQAKAVHKLYEAMQSAFDRLDVEMDRSATLFSTHHDTRATQRRHIESIALTGGAIGLHGLPELVAALSLKSWVPPQNLWVDFGA